MIRGFARTGLFCTAALRSNTTHLVTWRTTAELCICAKLIGRSESSLSPGMTEISCQGNRLQEWKMVNGQAEWSLYSD